MEQPYELKYERSPNYKFAAVDAAAVAVLGDAISARVNLSFSRLDIKLLTEKVMRDGNQVRFLDNPNGATTEAVRTIEFTAELRVDHAFALLKNLRNALGKLPEGIRRSHGLDDALLDTTEKVRQG